MNHDAISYEDLGKLLVQLVPEVESAYQKELEWWGDEQPGQHVVFGDVLFPHIVALFESGQDEGQLRRIFDFIESLACHPDEKVQEVIAVTICGDICADEIVLQKAQKFIGKKTREFCDSIIKTRKSL